MVKFGFFLFTFVPLVLFGQQNLLPISSFYKDQLLAPRNNSFGVKPSFYPRTEGEYDLQTIIRDSSKQYYELTERLFKKHLFEIKGDQYSINISPVLNMALGKDYSDTLERRLFNNTRGFLIEVDLTNKFSFSTSLYENQNRFTQYETAYYLSAGERYPNPLDSSYSVVNAVIPGAARTKPFKVDGFDYAYAIGNMIYAPKSYLRFMVGNNANFVGEGYRSLFLSDNSVPSIYARADVTFAKKFDYTFLRSKQFNLMRRPISTTVEAYYQPKLYSSQFLNYRVTDKLSISIFEGSYWNVGDSISSKPVEGAYYIPIPFVGSFITNQQNVNTLSGLQMTYLPVENLRIYGQFALSNWNSKTIGSQIGVRYYNPFGLKEGLLQVEYNNVPKRMYLSENTQLNYSSTNLPTAHPKGNGFEEYILRFIYSKRRLYGDIKSIVYVLKNYESGNLIASNFNLIPKSGSVYNQQLEVGYRVNKKINLEIFVQHIYRSSSLSSEIPSNTILFGLRTGLINHYNDF